MTFSASPRVVSQLNYRTFDGKSAQKIRVLVAQAIDAKVDNDHDVSILKEVTRADKMLQQIDASLALQYQKDARNEPIPTTSSTR